MIGGDFENKIVIVTGSASGIGREIAIGFLDREAIVILADKQLEMLEETARNLSSDYPNKVYYWPLDVSNLGNIEKAFQEINFRFGKIDVLVNNAGGGLETPIKLLEVTEADWDLVVDVNMKGTFFCCQQAIKYMIKNRGGKIINISSIGARIASPVSGPQYAAAKGGVTAMTRRLAYEAGEYNITVNAIAPGTVISGDRMERVWSQLSNKQQENIIDAIPMGRVSIAEDQVKGVLFLASDAADYITGITLDINGGRFMG